MLRKLLNGFVFGVGFALAFVLVYTAWMFWALPNLFEYMEPEETSGGPVPVNERPVPPSVADYGEFLGASSSYNSDFIYNPGSILSGGDASIAGHVLAKGEPREGVRLRLALNGSVMSQWAVTNAEGRYEIRVPAGEYRIDGHELDRRSAKQFLAGLIDPPNRKAFGEERFTLRPGEVAPGLNLEYIAPVVKLGPTGQVSLATEIIARWEAYPGAALYRLQVLKSARPDFLDTRQIVFERHDRPEVHGTEADLLDIGVPLEAGHFYYIEIMALDSGGRELSQTPRRYWISDFEVVE